MKVTVKLYASLTPYLPPGTVKNETVLDVPEGTTPVDILNQFNVPAGSYKLVLVDGVYIQPEERGTRALVEGEVLAVWPPVAGG